MREFHTWSHRSIDWQSLVELAMGRLLSTSAMMISSSPASTFFPKEILNDLGSPKSKSNGRNFISLWIVIGGLQ